MQHVLRYYHNYIVKVCCVKVGGGNKRKLKEAGPKSWKIVRGEDGGRTPLSSFQVDLLHSSGGRVTVTVHNIHKKRTRANPFHAALDRT